MVGCQAYEYNIRLWTAPELTGPWTGTDVYTVPHLPGQNVAYAAKSHPEYAAEDEIVFTYNTNGDDQTSYIEIYRPRFVRL
eukprot:CAMPEP_0180658804 /NCGR_PEP_ID=MMETSP1037_2-20121125/57212_1 /TAXON_ID=632150 /ORGANISM="Azadinium spinosum, Strain 3D9" /LENGTH=80 /DNA_ID=CAMNT_0022685741 /DNA_START=1 /DNA_END=239 /DNA_ORIENTATION=-